jgi:hypothetical protein
MIRSRATLACLVALCAATPAAAEFPNVRNLVQEELRDLVRDMGSVVAYKGVTPATPLGPLGFDIGIEVTETSLEHSRIFALAGAGDRARVLIPKVHAHKGLPLGLDVSAFVGGATQVDATIVGAALRWTFSDDTLVMPAVGVRLSGSRATGTGDLKVSTAAVDLMVSKKFTAITPFAGAGTVRTQASVAGGLLREEKVDQGRVFGGVNVNLLAANLAFEAEKMGENVSLSAKLGWRF